MSNQLNYKHLHYFWTIATEGSITKASEKLHITPQTISGQLSQLEERIGSPLFTRVGRRLELTETGQLVLNYANEIFALGQELSDVLRGAPAEGPAEFIVGNAMAIPKTIVYKILEPALHLPKPVSLTCKESDLSLLLGELAIHKVDLVLSDTPLDRLYNIKAYNHYLGESDLSVFGAPALAKSYRRDFPSRLQDAPMLLLTQQYAIRRQIDAWLEARQLYPRVVGQFDDSALMKSFGQAGVGLFILPSIIEDEVCRNFGVRVVGQLEQVKQKFYAISAERKVRHPAVAAIYDSARDELFT